MPAATLPLVTVRGRVRSADPLTRDTQRGRETFGTRLTVLTEPNGGFLEVTVFPELVPLDEALTLAGTDVEALVTLGVFVSNRGNGFQQATAMHIESLSAKAAPAKAPAA